MQKMRYCTKDGELMKQVLVLEIDITNTGDSCMIAVQMAQLENRSGIDRQIFVKRSSRDKFLAIPETGNDNFVLSVTEKTYES